MTDKQVAVLEMLPSLFRDSRLLGHRNFQHVPRDSQMPGPTPGGIKSEFGLPLFSSLYKILQTATSQKTSVAPRYLENEVQLLLCLYSRPLSRI